MTGETPKLTPDVVRRLGSLARLRLDPGEIESLAKDLASILSYMKVLDELSLEGVPPLAHPMDVAAPLCADEERPGIDPSLALREAPRIHEGHFAVPQVVELTRRDGPGAKEGNEA
jgi:aspartyl-tRNA(Asn)/glutamyl-tRNA(Gln) amidotransferase subunit C